jgi:hypothetical protein
VFELSPLGNLYGTTIPNGTGSCSPFYQGDPVASAIKLL